MFSTFRLFFDVFSTFFTVSINVSEMSVWDGVVVNPLERAYEKPADSQGEEDMEAEEGDMETE